jgi:hypothetical protein
MKILIRIILALGLAFASANASLAQPGPTVVQT